jgi:dihydroneopterin aldolase
MHPDQRPFGQQTFTLSNLRLKASLGILEPEKIAPQPIRVDLELNLGRQALLPQDDHIGQVLDYRRVRQIVLDTSTAQHVHLLETLVGQLSQRLMQLPEVLGVRLKVTKLHIFDDCEVAIGIEVGQW